MTVTAAAGGRSSTAERSLLARLVDGDLDEEILEVVGAALTRAGRPVSLPGLMNVLWFGQGQAGGYEGVAVGEYLDHLATVTHEPDPARRLGEPQDAVPLGALVRMTVGNDEAWGEVIWKEGAHPLVCGDWVPSWLAGAPAGMPYDGPPAADFAPPEGPQVLRERMVVDFDCLGEGLIRPPKLERERRLERRLDRYGHVIAEVVYRAGLDQADEVGFWAAWTARHQADALAAAGVPAERAGLAEAATVLAAALDGRSDVRSFGPYYMDRDLYDTLCGIDAADDGPLHRVVRGLALLPHRETVAWASMSARLAEEADPDSLIGSRWPTAVVCASLLTLDTLSERAADGDWNGVHLRLDDTWQGGGLWRAELLDSTTPVAADPAIALGLGWVAWTGGEIERLPAPPPEEADGQGLFDEDDLSWEVTGSDVTWSTHLSAADLDRDRLRVPARISELIAATFHALGQDQLVVVLRHDGEAEDRDWSGLDADGHLSFAWPLGMWPGTTVRVSWAIGRTVVIAETTLLAEPESVGGIVYTHEFNLAVALAAAGLAEPVARTASISQLVRAAVRRHGAVTEDGRVALPLEEVVAFCFGPHGEATPGYHRRVLYRAVRSAVAAMVAAGTAAVEGELVIVSERVTNAARQADAELLARFVEAQARRLRRAAYLHYVPATVVNLQAGHSRSKEKDDTWAAVAGTDKLPEVLGPHQTWRRRHTRGSAMSPDLVAELERARQAAAALGADEAVTAVLDDVLDDPFNPTTASRPGPDGGHSSTSGTSQPQKEQR